MTPHRELQISKISKNYVGVKALDSVSFCARSGEILGLVGVNGAGKSTLMNILGGLTEPSSGEILLDGQPLRIRSPQDSERLGIGFIHQEPVLFRHMTVAENIGMSKLRPLVRPAQLHQEARHVLERVDPGIDPGEKVADLPIGKQQMVCIARALREGGRILLFDEPTSSFTEAEKKMLFSVIRSLREQGAIIFYISHFLDEIEEICDRVVVLRDGKLISDTPMNEISRLQLLHDMISGEIAQADTDAVPQPGDVVLDVQKLCRKNVLEQVSLQLHKGEILGVWGLMGSGRTELLRAIYGLDRVDSGTVCVRNAQGRLQKCTRRQACRHLGFLTEDRHADGIFLGWSIWENITAPNLSQFRRKSGFLDFRRARREAAELSESVHVKTPDVDVRAEALSGGNQQKVILAKWLMRRPAVFLLDEPTRGVDVGAKAEIQRMLRQYARQGTAMLVVSSELEELTLLSDRLLVMNHGKITAELSKKEISKDSVMSYCL